MERKKTSVKTISRCKQRKTVCLFLQWGSGESIAVRLMEYLTTTFSFDIHPLFISSAFFKLSLGVAELFNELI